MNNKMIICVGVSGSGKSTYALQHLKDNPQTLRVNRDSLRLALVGSLEGYYERRDMNILELIVNGFENHIALCASVKGYDLIIDNTNLKRDYIRRWVDVASEFGFERSFRLFPCELEKAKQRVAKRDFRHPNDLDYIVKQCEQFKSIEEYIITSAKAKLI